MQIPPSAAAVSDAFLDTALIETNNSLTYAVNAPTKYVSNPLLNDNGSYDSFFNSVHVIDDGSGTLKMYGDNWSDETPQKLYTTYRTSTDGLAWAKPNLGLISYGGNTNNNILLAANVGIPAPFYNAGGAAGQQYILGIGLAGTNVLRIYGASNGIAFSQLNDFTGRYGSADFQSLSGICKDPTTGRWLVWPQNNYSDLRGTSTFVSDSSDITGTFQGGRITNASPDAQHEVYAVCVNYHDGLYLGFVPTYNGSTDKQIGISLHVSRDGYKWTQKKDESWLPIVNATWESGTIYSGDGLIHIGNEWWFYYVGSTSLEHTSPVVAGYIGLAKIGYQRLGQVSGTGDITTQVMTTGPSYALVLNANGTGGSVKAEVLDDTGAVIPGYSKDSMDNAITGDTYATTVTWGGLGLPATKRIKLKFYLTSAILYHYSAG